MDCLESVRFQIPMRDGLIATINEFRRQNGIGPVEHWDARMAEFCKNHCIEMTRRGQLYHAEPCYLEGWSEAVAMCSHMAKWEDTQGCLIFDCLGTSEPHRRLLLDKNCMAYAVWSHNWMVYLTVRGR